MPFAASLSEHPLATHAVGEVVGDVLEQFGDRPDFAVLFVTAPFAGAMEDVAAAVRELLRPHALVGCTAVSVLGGPREVEERAAVSLFAGRSGSVLGRLDPSPRPRAVHVDARREGDGWRITAPAGIATPGGTVVLLADPHSFPVDGFVDGLVGDAPGLTVVGGLASAGDGPGGNRLVADGAVVSSGAVALVLPPERDAEVVVSQGCRPVGEPLVVTASSGNLLEEIAGRPALERLLEQADAAAPEDRALMARGLHVGIVVDERQESFGQGDFLVRNVLGADKARGAVAVGAEVPVGTTVQFQVRDADSADQDLRRALAGVDAGGALVFTCNGRGRRLFGQDDHDASVVDQHVRGRATAGMFCAGEIGPVGGRPFVHGFTASVLLLRD